MKYEYVVRTFEVKGLSPIADLSFNNLFYGMACHAPLSSAICIDFDVVAESKDCLDYTELLKKFPEFKAYEPTLNLNCEVGSGNRLTAFVQFIERWEIDEETESVEECLVIGEPEMKTYKIHFPKYPDGDNVDRYMCLDGREFQATNDFNAEEVISAMTHHCERKVPDEELLESDFCVFEHVLTVDAEGELTKVEF